LCGICGVSGRSVDPSLLAAATETLHHRGPDDDGYFIDQGIALGMRRLSVIDVKGGAQPQSNESGSIRVIFNGEIYNFKELRAELERFGHSFASDSDTHVIAHAYEQWGTSCFGRMNGIFAIAIWDGKEQTLVLARDHIGVKPLYYAVDGGTVVFGSELKAVLPLLSEPPTIDPTAVALFLRLQYVPTPRTIYLGISKLPPGHMLVAPQRDRSPQIRCYWSPLQ
jgi:asparagine synthase (glutamine-hydrolysing)